MTQLVVSARASVHLHHRPVAQGRDRLSHPRIKIGLAEPPDALSDVIRKFGQGVRCHKGSVPRGAGYVPLHEIV
jgi:hypothetical protein